MAPVSRQSIELEDFPGLITNLTGSSVPPAAAIIQFNLMPNRVGELATRPGLAKVTFEDDA